MKKRVLLVLFLFFAALVSSYFAIEAYVNVKLKEKIDRRLSKLPYASSYSGFHYNLASNDIEFQNFVLKGTVFSLSMQELLVDLPYSFRKKGFPPYLRVVVKDGVFRVELPLLEELLGESLFRFDVDGWYKFDGSRFVFSFFLSLGSLGEIYLNAEVDNLDYPTVERFFEGRTTVNALINRGKLSRFEVVLKDRGLYDRFLHYAAKQEGATPEEVKKELLAMVRQSFSGELRRNIGAALQEFIENPTCLKVEIKPEQPVSLKELKKFVSSRPDVEEMVRELGIRFSLCD